MRLAVPQVHLVWSARFEQISHPNDSMRLNKLLAAPGAACILLFALLAIGVGSARNVQAQSCQVISAIPPTGGAVGAGIVVNLDEARGSTLMACADGELAEIKFGLDFATSLTAEVQIYAGAAPFSQDPPPTRLASQSFVPDDYALNTVTFVSPASVTGGALYTFLLVPAGAGTQINGQQSNNSPGVICTAGSCVTNANNEILYDVTINTPEIDVTYGPISILDGDLVSTEIEQDFGSVEIGGAPIVRTYKIDNTLGLADLTVSSISLGSISTGGASHFSLSASNLTVAAGGTTDLDITFDPSDAGNHVAILTLVNDEDGSDGDTEESYEFHIQGQGLMDLGDLPAMYDVATIFDVANDPARHRAIGSTLGSERDLEADGQTSADAGFDGSTGDDGTDDADEDGVTFFHPEPGAPSVFAQYLEGSTVSVEVELGGLGVTASYLQVFLDADFDGLDAGDQVVTNELLAAGTNVVTFEVPTGGGAFSDVALRFRLTSYISQAGSEVLVDGRASDGEVEDYVVDILASPADIDVNMNTDEGTLGYDGTDVVYTDSAGNVIFQGPAASMASIDILGGTGNSVLTITGAMATLGIPISFDGGTGENEMIIEAAASTQIAVDHVFDNAMDGLISIAPMGSIAYFNLSPITDNMSAVARTFDFADPGAEVITLSADGDGSIGNGYSFIDSDVGGEQVIFANPTTSIAITSSGGGAETFNLGNLDTPLAGTFAMISVDGGTEADLFTVTPSDTYFIDIVGGAPVGTCPGDALTFDLTKGAVIDTITPGAPGAGTVSFLPPHVDVTYAGIESIGEADIEVSLNYTIIYATEDLSVAAGNELIVTATNSGPYDANCVTVAISAELDDWLADHGAVPSGGSIVDVAGSLWSIPALAVGASETLTITGLAVPNTPQDVTFTSSATQDTNVDNDVASLELSLGFVMPTKTQVNSALYYSKTTAAGDTYEALIVGLFQGSPGIDGAVWCKIPDEIMGVWPVAPLTPQTVGDHWRPCADDLPFPLHVNDLYQDSNDKLWLATWGSKGLYSSEDGGESWTAAEPVLGPKLGWALVYTIIEDAADDVLYISANNGLVFRSFNDGVTWQQVASLPGGSADTPWSMVAHPSRSGTVYAGTFGNGVFVSDDYGFTWVELDDAGTLLVNENDALLDTDASGDDFAGHIFDLEFSPDALAGDDVLYVGTGSGVWRAVLTTGTASTFTTGWTQIGPDVVLDSGTVIPEVRNLAFATDLGGDDDLVAGTWGFGAYVWDDPNTMVMHQALTLREGFVTFVAVSEAGSIFVGTSDFGNTFLTAADATSTASEPDANSQLPDGFVLSQNYPNPFNPVTTIGFALPQTGKVRLAVYDALGREVALLVDGTIQAGQHDVQFSAGNLPTGAYLYRLRTEAGTLSRTLVLMK
jgi:Domain of unknown function DUF11/Secretion system C-terminal sorting domain/GEVED domain